MTNASSGIPIPTLRYKLFELLVLKLTTNVGCLDVHTMGLKESRI